MGKKPMISLKISGTSSPHSLLFRAQNTPVDFCHASAFALIATTSAIFERYARSPATPLAPTLQPKPPRTRSPSCLSRATDRDFPRKWTLLFQVILLV
ncbi:hypothetical protein ACKLNR_007905 [Fusarium oxysporum f. sp. zingiberi]